MSKFHVTCVYPNGREKKKIVTLQNTGQSQTIRLQFNLAADGNYQIQLFNEEFNDWVDVDEWQDLTGGRKLKIIVNPSMQYLFIYFMFVVLTLINTYARTAFVVTETIQ